MKEIYEEPKMFTLLFENMDIVTLSLAGEKEEGSGEDDYENIFG